MIIWTSAILKCVGAFDSLMRFFFAVVFQHHEILIQERASNDISQLEYYCILTRFTQQLRLFSELLHCTVRANSKVAITSAINITWAGTHLNVHLLCIVRLTGEIWSVLKNVMNLTRLTIVLLAPLSQFYNQIDLKSNQHIRFRAQTI